MPTKTKLRKGAIRQSNAAPVSAGGVGAHVCAEIGRKLFGGKPLPVELERRLAALDRVFDLLGLGDTVAATATVVLQWETKTPPTMTLVESSNVANVEYRRFHQELHVRFKNDRMYVYYAVPDECYRGLVDAESVGSYLNREIKPNYSCNAL